MALVNPSNVEFHVVLLTAAFPAPRIGTDEARLSHSALVAHVPVIGARVGVALSAASAIIRTTAWIKGFIFFFVSA